MKKFDALTTVNILQFKNYSIGAILSNLEMHAWWTVVIAAEGEKREKDDLLKSCLIHWE